MAENHSAHLPEPAFQGSPYPFTVSDSGDNSHLPSPSLAEEEQAGSVAIMSDSPASSRTISYSPEPERPNTPAQAHMASLAPTPEAGPHHEVPSDGAPRPHPAVQPASLGVYQAESLNGAYRPMPPWNPRPPPVLQPMPSWNSRMRPVLQPMPSWNSRPPPVLQPVPSVPAWNFPLPVSNLSTTDFMHPYPPIGKLAMTRSGSEEVVVAGPSGLAHFRRVLDHPSKPWSQPRLLPPKAAVLNSSTITGLAIHEDMDQNIRVYCVAEGKMHAFSCPGDIGTPLEGFVVDSCTAFDDFEITGCPAAATLSERVGGFRPDRTLRWCVVVPYGPGGLLYSETKAPRRGSYDLSEPPEQRWTDASRIAEHLGAVTAVAIAVTHVHKTPRLDDDPPTEIVAACIAGGRLHSIEGIFKPGEETWGDGALEVPIQHPGYVVGNPVLLSEENERGQYQLDLLVPSAEGGIFHFVRTANTPREWHMIGRVSFRMGLPVVSSLACARLGWPQFGDNSAPASSIHAIVQCDGKLYFIKTSESATPWAGSRLYPILGPGPFPH